MIRNIPQIFIFMTYRNNFIGTQNEFESAMVNEPSMFEPLRFDCVYKTLYNSKIIYSQIIAAQFNIIIISCYNFSETRRSKLKGGKIGRIRLLKFPFISLNVFTLSIRVP